MKRWVRGCGAENGSLFCPSDFAIAPFFFFFFLFQVVLISGAFFILPLV